MLFDGIIESLKSLNQSIQTVNVAVAATSKRYTDFIESIGDRSCFMRVTHHATLRCHSCCSCVNQFMHLSHHYLERPDSDVVKVTFGRLYYQKEAAEEFPHYHDCVLMHAIIEGVDDSIDAIVMFDDVADDGCIAYRTTKVVCHECLLPQCDCDKTGA